MSANISAAAIRQPVREASRLVLVPLRAAQLMTITRQRGGRDGLPAIRISRTEDSAAHDNTRGTCPPGCERPGATAIST